MKKRAVRVLSHLFPSDYFSIFRTTLLPSLSLTLVASFHRSLVRPSSSEAVEAARRSDEDPTYVVTTWDDRRMILGRHSPLVKFAGELLRRRCQINRGKALLSRSNRRGRETARRRELGRDTFSFTPIVKKRYGPPPREPPRTSVEYEVEWTPI